MKGKLNTSMVGRQVILEEYPALENWQTNSGKRDFRGLFAEIVSAYMPTDWDKPAFDVVITDARPGKEHLVGLMLSQIPGSFFKRVLKVS